jgi:hypothetical protein
MRTITIIIAIFALGLITGILMIQIPKLANPSLVDTTEPFMVHELPPPHSGVGTTSKYAGEVTKIDGASDEENVAELTHDTTAYRHFGADIKAPNAPPGAVGCRGV